VGIDVVSKEFHDRLTDLSIRVHGLARDNGWYDNPVDFITFVNNFHGEISEAWEEYRSGRPITEIWESGGGKPEGFFVEIADFVIRVLDYAGSIGKEEIANRCACVSKYNQDGLIDHMHRINAVEFINMLQRESRFRRLGFMVVCCFVFADANGIDLWSVIERKHEYNKTRTYRHGGKIA
jgi:hypothetical protein